MFGGKVPLRPARLRAGEKPYLIARVGMDRAVQLGRPNPKYRGAGVPGRMSNCRGSTSTDLHAASVRLSIAVAGPGLSMRSLGCVRVSPFEFQAFYEGGAWSAFQPSVLAWTRTACRLSATGIGKHR